MRHIFCTLLIPALLMIGVNIATAQDTEEWGLASYYDDSFQGKQTAYGVEYNKNELTGAHKLHPFGTRLKVTRLDNQKTVTIKVIDKGPYIKGRVIDLSRAAAERLGLIQDGVAEVKVEVVGRAKASKGTVKVDEIPDSYEPSAPRRKSDAEIAAQQPTPQPESKPETRTTSAEKQKTSSAKKSKITVPIPSTATASKARLVGKEFEQYGVYKISIQKPEEGNYGVQIASLSNYQNVFRQVADLQERSFDDILVKIEEGRTAPIYKIILGPFESEAAADNYRKNLASRYKIKGFVTELEKVEKDR